MNSATKPLTEPLNCAELFEEGPDAKILSHHGNVKAAHGAWGWRFFSVVGFPVGKWFVETKFYDASSEFADLRGYRLQGFRLNPSGVPDLVI